MSPVLREVSTQADVCVFHQAESLESRPSFWGSANLALALFASVNRFGELLPDCRCHDEQMAGEISLR